MQSEFCFSELQGFEHWACPVRLASVESVTPVFNLSLSLSLHFHYTHSCMRIDHFQPTNLYSQLHTSLWESPLFKHWWTVVRVVGISECNKLCIYIPDMSPSVTREGGGVGKEDHRRIISSLTLSSLYPLSLSFSHYSPYLSRPAVRLHAFLLQCLIGKWKCSC